MLQETFIMSLSIQFYFLRMLKERGADSGDQELDMEAEISQ